MLVRIRGPAELRENGTHTITPQFNTTVFERMQTALKLMDCEDALISRELVAQIMGTPTAPLSTRVRIPRVITPPSMRALNTAQEAAVRQCLEGPGLHLWQGPPGTGKTATIVSLVYHMVCQGDGQVLICAPSNTAATRVAEQIAKVGLKGVRLMPRTRAAESAALDTSLQLPHHVDSVHTKAAQTIEGIKGLALEFGALPRGAEKLLSTLETEVNAEAVRRADVVCLSLIHI